MADKEKLPLTIHKNIFGKLDKKDVYLFKLSNSKMDVAITNYGATIVSIEVPDKEGNKKNVVTGFDNLYQYFEEHPYFGCIVGRFANRIAFGKFSIDRIEYHLPINNGSNHLHGGINGFNKKLWKLEGIIQQENSVGVVFVYDSIHNEEGYPGNLTATVTYSLTNNNELVIDYKASTDKSTIINLTNHSYFNLTGFEEETIYNHHLKLYSSSYTVKNENNVPTGEIAVVKNTFLDFSTTKKIGKHINQFASDKGYDHNYVLNNKSGDVVLAAELYEPQSGRLLKVFTDQPGVQVYTANWFDGSFIGSQHKPYLKHCSIALETQAFPDAPNHTNFPNTVLRPDDLYTTKTVYQFSIS